jgi:ABC-type nitrate/sulfonate/bicarbonate transport system permease component
VSTRLLTQGFAHQLRRLDPSVYRGVTGLVTFAVLLEGVPRLGLVSPHYLPPLSAMLVGLIGEASHAEFWRALSWTLSGWGLGLAIAVVLGAVLGAAIGSNRLLTVMTHSTIEFLRPIPSVAMIPLAVLLFGTRIQSVLLVSVYATVWLVLIQVLYGVQSVDPIARETVRSYRLARTAVLRYLVWPTVLPYLITGTRIAAGVALIVTITAELVIGAPGLGREIEAARSGGAVAVMYAYVIVAGVIGVSVNVVFRLIETRLLAWRQQQAEQ